MIWASKKTHNRLPSVLLEGFRVYMRPPLHADRDDWIAVRAKNQDFLKPFEPAWPENSLNEDFYERRLLRQVNNWVMDKHQPFLIFTKDDDLIGGMNINNICRGAAQYASLGYWIDEGFQGQGYMREALQLTIKYCFDDLDLHRLHAACLPDNERSKKLLLSAGFLEEGFAEKYLQINGNWADHILFGLPREKWEIPERA